MRARVERGHTSAFADAARSPDLRETDRLDPEAPIDWSKRIRSLETFSAAFRTADGARPGARVSELTRLYGPTRTIDTTEIESREYITFARHPERLRFRLDETRRAILSTSVSSF